MVASKFTNKTTTRILQAAALGCSQETCAAVAGIDQGTLSRWLTRGEKELQTAESPDAPDTLSAYARFAQTYHANQGALRERALGIISREMDTNPGLAWKLIERREPGFAPPIPTVAKEQAGPLIIQLSLHDGSAVPALAHSTVIDVADPVEGPDASNGGTNTPEGGAGSSPPPTVVSLADRSRE